MTAQPWFVRASTTDAPVRLFCFPYAGGNAAAFLPWQALLGPGVALRVAQLPGRGARLFEEPQRDLDALVAELTSAIAAETDRPFAFFGHSLGAIVAFEVTRALRRAGLPGPTGLWASGAEGPRSRLVKRRLHGLPDAELVEALRDYGGTPDELLDDAEMMELVLPGIRADFALSEVYRYRPEEPLDLPIHVLVGDRDPYVEPGRAAGWAHESRHPLRRHVFSGDHFFLFPHQATIAAMLTTALCSDPAKMP
jgi:medium-chain acyl-[acyl-carrier-protein] hydrolase